MVSSLDSPLSKAFQINEIKKLQFCPLLKCFDKSVIHRWEARMTLSLTTRRVEGTLVIDMCGKLTIYEDKFREFVRSSIQAGERSLVLRLAELSYLDSAGLGQLVNAYMDFSKAGGDVRLLAPSPRVRQLLKMTKLDTVFTILEDETAIRNSVNGGDLRVKQTERGPGTPERSLGAIG